MHDDLGITSRDVSVILSFLCDLKVSEKQRSGHYGVRRNMTARVVRGPRGLLTGCNPWFPVIPINSKSLFFFNKKKITITNFN